MQGKLIHSGTYMLGATLETEALAPNIDDLIKPYATYLDIVERPSVGLLAVPVEKNSLVIRVLTHSLISFMLRGCSKVTVKCGRATPSMLAVEVKTGSAWPPINEIWESSKLSELNQEANRLGGKIITGGEMFSGRPSLNVFFRLIVPIPL